jgi:hypothetical protein
MADTAQEIYSSAVLQSARLVLQVGIWLTLSTMRYTVPGSWMYFYNSFCGTANAWLPGFFQRYGFPPGVSIAAPPSERRTPIRLDDDDDEDDAPPPPRRHAGGEGAQRLTHDAELGRVYHMHPGLGFWWQIVEYVCWVVLLPIVMVGEGTSESGVAVLLGFATVAAREARMMSLGVRTEVPAQFARQLRWARISSVLMVACIVGLAFIGFLHARSMTAAVVASVVLVVITASVEVDRYRNYDF